MPVAHEVTESQDIDDGEVKGGEPHCPAQLSGTCKQEPKKSSIARGKSGFEGLAGREGRLGKAEDRHHA